MNSPLDFQKTINKHAARDGTAAGRYDGAPREHIFCFFKKLYLVCLVSFEFIKAFFVQCCTCSPVATGLLQQYCCNSIVNSTVETILLQQYCCNSTVATVQLQQYCCNSTVATILLQQYCCNSTVATVLLQQYCCNSTVAGPDSRIAG